MFEDRIRRFVIQKESPDVETPGLLVKALISSYFTGLSCTGISVWTNSINSFI